MAFGISAWTDSNIEVVQQAEPTCVLKVFELKGNPANISGQPIDGPWNLSVSFPPHEAGIEYFFITDPAVGVDEYIDLGGFRSKVITGVTVTGTTGVIHMDLAASAIAYGVTGADVIPLTVFVRRV